MRKLIVAGAIAAVGLGGALSSAPVGAADIVLKAGHSQNAGEPMDLGLQMIGEHLEKATGGKATLEVFPNMQLGGEVEMIKQVLTGSLDITSPRMHRSPTSCRSSSSSTCRSCSATRTT